MGYKSAAQRKAVHASKADGGKGNPNKMKVKGFDVKSKKAKNKRNYNKAIDLNADRYGPSATQSKFTFKAQPEKDFSMHNINARKTDGTIKQQRALREKTSPTLAKLSSSCKAAARRKLKVYPSAYANMWASRTQKKGKC